MHIHVENVSVRYARTQKPVLNNVSFEVPSGTTLVLLGPSGCGKTTILRALSGLVPIESGDIRFDGVRVVDQRPQERTLSLVQQSLALPAHMTVERYIALWPHIRYKKSWSESRRLAHEAAERIGISDLLNRFTGEISGGQRQRVAFAGRVLVVDEPIVLLDEPLSSVDVPRHNEMMALLKQCLQEKKTTAVHVTHNRREAEGLADAVAVVLDGRVQQIGTYAEISSRPANDAVASFLA